MAENRSLNNVAECRQAMRFLEWELLMLVRDLDECERDLAQHRRKFKQAKRKRAAIRRRCRDRMESIDLLRDLIHSSPDGRTLAAGTTMGSLPPGQVILKRLGELLEATDAEDLDNLYDFSRRLAELQEFGADWFDYPGVRLVRELEKLMADSALTEESDLKQFLRRISRLYERARRWFE